jgi:hypothetical protein
MLHAFCLWLVNRIGGLNAINTMAWKCCGAFIYALAFCVNCSACTSTCCVALATACLSMALRYAVCYAALTACAVLPSASTAVFAVLFTWLRVHASTALPWLRAACYVLRAACCGVLHAAITCCSAVSRVSYVSCSLRAVTLRAPVTAINADYRTTGYWNAAGLQTWALGLNSRTS